MPRGNGPFTYRLDEPSKWNDRLDQADVLEGVEAILIEEDQSKVLKKEAVLAEDSVAALFLDRHFALEILGQLEPVRQLQSNQGITEANIGAIEESVCNFLRSHRNYFQRFEKALAEVRADLKSRGLL